MAAPGIARSPNPLPATQLMDRMEQRLAQAGLPDEPIDPSTVHYALKRMIDDGLVLHRGKHEVDVPGPYGTTHRALRDVYLITGTGQAALRRKRQARSSRPQPGARAEWDEAGHRRGGAPWVVTGAKGADSGRLDSREFFLLRL